MANPTLQERMDIIKQVGEEILTEEDLAKLLSEKKKPIAYDGFEPSGNIHIAQGIMRAININKMLKAGCGFKMLVADWHGWANNKMGGDLEKIKTVGNYMIEVWKACGLDTDKVDFVWVSDYIKDPEYWKIVMQAARHTTLNRIVRCGQIMGRSEAEVLQASQILYPCMQFADIFHLGIDICQLGMDQRKVNILAREIGPKIGFWSPVVVNHHMLMGLSQPPKGDADSIERKIQLKMSKSNPDSAIFMTDTEEDIKRKIRNAYCPPKIVFENPIIEYAKYIVFEKFDFMEIERPAKFGGSLVINSINDLEDIYIKGNLHPLDLKNSVGNYINQLIHPVREYFSKGKAKKLLDEVNSFKVTR